MNNVDRSVSIKILYDINDPINKLKTLKRTQEELFKNKSNIAQTIAGSQEQIQKARSNYESLASRIREARIETEKLFMEMRRNPNNSDLARQYGVALTNLRQLAKEQHEFSNLVGHSTEKVNQLGGMIGGVLSSFKHHVSWIGAGALLYGMVEMPRLMTDVATETEALTIKLRQNLELAERYRDNIQLLDKDMEHLVNTAGVFSIAYSTDIKEVLDGMQLIGRAFKSPEQIIYLTSRALTMAKLDGIEASEAFNNLESVILQFGLNIEQTKDFVNDFTIAVHSSKISGVELLQAIQRSGSSFKQFNASSREAIAYISTLSSLTSRTGSTIGNTWKSLATSLTLDKAIAALDAYNIKVYETQENGTKIMRKGANIFKEITDLFQRLDDEGKQKLSYAISGGKYQINALLSMLNDANVTFNRIMNDMQTMSSDTMTNELLKLGLESFQAKLMALRSSFQVLSQNVGEETLPVLKELTDELTQGVYWIIENKEQVNKFIRVVGTLAQAYILWRTQALLTQGALFFLNNTLTGTTLGITAMYALEGKFMAAMTTMASGVGVLGAALTRLSMQLAIAYVGAQVLMSLGARLSDKSGLTGKIQDQSQKVVNLQWALNNIDTASTRSGIPKEQLSRELTDQLIREQGRLDHYKEQQKRKETEYAKKAAKEQMDAYNEIIKQQGKLGHVNSNTVPTIPNKVGTTNSPGKNGGHNKEENIPLENALDNLRILKDRNEISLEEEENYLDRVLQKHAKTAEEKKRIQKMLDDNLTAQINEFTNKAKKAEEDKVEMQKKTSEQILALTLSEHEQKLIALNAEKQEKYLAGLSALEVEKWYALEKRKLDDEENKRKYDRMANILNYNMEEALVSAKTKQEENAIKLKNAIDNLANAEQRLKDIQNSGKSAEEKAEEIARVRVEIAKYKKEVEELEDRYKEVREAAADMFSSILIDGNSFSSWWKRQWQALAQDALNSIFRIKSQSSFLGSLFGIGGIFGGSSGKVVGDVVTANIAHEGGIIKKYHSGGIVKRNMVDAIRDIKGNEVPAILLEDEEVLSHKDRRTVGVMANTIENMAKIYTQSKPAPYVPVISSPVVREAISEDGLSNPNAQQSKQIQNMQNKMDSFAMVMEKLFDKINSMGSATQININAVDAKSVAELFNSNSDVLTQVLRKEKAMGNGI